MKKNLQDKHAQFVLLVYPITGSGEMEKFYYYDTS